MDQLKSLSDSANLDVDIPKFTNNVVENSSIEVDEESAPQENINLNLNTNFLTFDKTKISYYYTEMLCANFFTFLLIIKMIHWQTDSYSIHKSTDELYSRFNELMDELVETLQGEFLLHTNNQLGKVIINNDCKIVIKDQTNNGKPDNYLNLLKNVQHFLTVDFEVKLKEILPNSNLSSILNIRDEMLGEIQKARYLVTLK